MVERWLCFALLVVVLLVVVLWFSRLPDASTGYTEKFITDQNDVPGHAVSEQLYTNEWDILLAQYKLKMTQLAALVKNSKDTASYRAQYMRLNQAAADLRVKMNNMLTGGTLGTYGSEHFKTSEYDVFGPTIIRQLEKSNVSTLSATYKANMAKLYALVNNHKDTASYKAKYTRAKTAAETALAKTLSILKGEPLRIDRVLADTQVNYNLNNQPVYVPTESSGLYSQPVPGSKDPNLAQKIMDLSKVPNVGATNRMSSGVKVYTDANFESSGKQYTNYIEHAGDQAVNTKKSQLQISKPSGPRGQSRSASAARHGTTRG